jgi:hypothetical protein
LGSSRFNFLSRESLIASQKIGAREIERKSGRGGESKRRKAGCDLFVGGSALPSPPVLHTLLLRPSAMNLHNGHDHKVLGGRVLKRRINFLFYGFLIKGLGAEILAPED